MRGFLLGLIVALSLQAPKLPLVEKDDELSDLSKLKADNFKLKTQLTQCRVDLLDREAKLASLEFTREQSRLEESFKKELGCKPEQKFDWAKLVCSEK